MTEKLRVALLAGGKSGERQVSLDGAEEVYKALDPARYEVSRYDPATDLARLVNDSGKIDVAFVLLHGPLGEDGAIQGFLDLLNIPYQGSGMSASAMAMDKNIAKIIYQKAGLTVPRWVMASASDLSAPERILRKLPLPLVVKPLGQGSSLGMSIAAAGDELISGLSLALQYDRDVMVEEYISGREITCGVLGNDDLMPLPLIEIIPGESHPFFDYNAKYKPGASQEICPADLDEEISARAQGIALTAHQALKLRGCSRTDMIVSDKEIFVLETNTIPGMTRTSLLPRAARAAGISFAALVDRLLDLALGKR